MLRLERISSIQTLVWLNAIAENDPWDESAGENVCEGLYQVWANSDQV